MAYSFESTNKLPDTISGGGVVKTANLGDISQVTAQPGQTAGNPNLGGLSRVTAQPGQTAGNPNATPTTYKPTYQSGTMTGENAQNIGLGTANNIMQGTLNNPYTYPGDISTKMLNPANTDISANVGYDPMQQVSGLQQSDFDKMQQMGTTQGLTREQYNQMANSIAGTDALAGGDYARLEQALMDPIERQGIAAQQRISDQYGGQGLYGSVGGGLMSGAQADSQFATQDALSNALVNRYNLQLADRGLTQNEQQAQSNALNQALGLEQGDRAMSIGENQAIADNMARAYGLQLDNQGQMIDQNKNLFTSGAASADQQNAYNLMRDQTNQQNQQQQNDFRNQLLNMQQQYAINKGNYQTGIDEMNFQRALQLAGQGNSGAAVQANQQAAQDAADAQQQAALYGGVGSIAGGLMGNYDGSGNSGWNFGDLKFW